MQKHALVVISQTITTEQFICEIDNATYLALPERMRSRVEVAARYDLRKNEADELQFTKIIFIVVVVASVLLSVVLIGSGLVEFGRLSIPVIVYVTFWIGAAAESALVPGLTCKEKWLHFASIGAQASAGLFCFIAMLEMGSVSGHTDNHAAIRQEAMERTNGGN